jgi:hypothetical protein
MKVDFIGYGAERGFFFSRVTDRSLIGPVLTSRAGKQFSIFTWRFLHMWQPHIVFSRAPHRVLFSAPVRGKRQTSH